MASCLGLYIEENIIKYAKLSKDNEVIKIDAFGTKFYDRLDNAIEQIVEEGMKKGEIKKGDPKAIAAGIYGLICSGLVYKLRKKEEMTIMELYKQFEDTIIKGLEV